VLGEGGTDFGLLETVGQELRTMKVPFAEGWGDMYSYPTGESLDGLITHSPRNVHIPHV
jgi:hypothetical protein